MQKKGKYMAIKTDYHLHSFFSGDCSTSMEDMILKGIDLGLTHMCFTEHHDEGFIDEHGNPSDMFLLNADSYLYELLKYKEKYANQIKILFGVELGIQSHVTRALAKFVKAHEYDFVLASSHLCEQKDPYYPSFYEGRSEKEAYFEYFSAILKCIKMYSNFDVYAHLDYVVRYGPNKDREYSYFQYADVLDEILKHLIENEKGIELNTGGIRRGLSQPNPSYDIIKRYKELGGEIITVGSDAHSTASIAYGFDTACEALKTCGFKYYTIFEGRMPEFKSL